jgi:hypothetical protein
MYACGYISNVLSFFYQFGSQSPSKPTLHDHVRHRLQLMECFQLIHFKHNVHFGVKLNDLKIKRFEGFVNSMM